MEFRRKLLLAALLTAVPLVFAALLEAAGALPALELRLLDLRYRYFNPGREMSKDIYVIEIDQKTFQAYASNPIFGYWPWRRCAYGPALDLIEQGAPRRVMFDIMFFGITPDDSCMENFNQTYPNLSHAIALRSETVPDGESLEPVPLPPEILRHAQTVELAPGASRLRDYNGADFPVGSIGASMPFAHSVSFDNDPDGVARRMRPYSRYNGAYFPTMSIVAYQSYYPSTEIKLADQRLTLKSAERTLTVPLVNGQYLLNYYSPDEIHRMRRERAVTIAAVLDTKLRIETGDVDDPAKLLLRPWELQDKIVLIAATAPATLDLKTTPYGRLPGVYLHAIMLSNMLEGHFLSVAPPWLNWLLAVLLTPLGVGLALLTHRNALRIGAPAAILILATLAGLYLFQVAEWVIGLAPFLAAYPLAFLGSIAVVAFTEGRDKLKVRLAMSKYLSPDVLNDVLSRKSLGAEVGERRPVTVIFTDIRSFTTMSEQMDAAEVVSLLNEYLSHMVDAIFRSEGTLDKFIGDAIMAFWNAPQDQPDHARRAVLTGLEMVRELYRLHDKWKHEGKPLLMMGVGVNTGEVIVGNIGGDKRLDYTIIGDNVNLGSRLEGLTKNYGVDMLISQSTYDALGQSDIVCRTLDLVAVKGKSKPIRIFEPIAPDAPPRIAGLANAAYAVKNDEAFQAYLDRRFDDAIQLYRELIHIDRGEDLTAKMMIERCEALKVSPPPPGWDGTLVMKTK